MATHDYVIDNSTGANVRADINNVLQAILTNNSNSSAPSTTAAYMLWADTTANIVKIRNSANNAWINLFTTAGGIDVDAASNFNEDVTFTGASYNVVWDKSDDALEFADNAKAKFGASDDLQIYHDGSNSYLANTTGTLLLQNSGQTTVKGTTVQFENAAGSEVLLKAVENGANTLYFDNGEKFATVSIGANVTGRLRVTDYVDIANGANLFLEDGGEAVFGNGSDLKIYHDGTHNRYDSANGAHIFRTAGNDNQIFMSPNLSVEIYYDGSKKLETNSSGITVTGNSYVTGNDDHPDNSKARFGTSNDFEIYHDGSNSYLQHGDVGNLRYQSNNHDFYKKDGTEFMCRMFMNSGVNLYFGHALKLQTDTNGINVSGSVHGASTISTSNGNDASATFDRQGSSGTLVELRFGGTNKGTISVNSSNAAFNTSASDRTLKKNFESWNENVLNLFKNINPQKFNFIDQQDTDAKSKGFIAQDLVESFPEGYTKNKENKYMFNPSGMVVYLMKAIQELESKVAALEAA